MENNVEKFNKFYEIQKNTVLRGRYWNWKYSKIYYLSNKNASTVFAIDASESIDFAFKKYGKKSNLHFLQADLSQVTI